MAHINPFEKQDLLKDRLIRYDFEKQILLEGKERHKSKKEFTEGILTGLVFGILGNFFVSLIFEFFKTPNFGYGAGLIAVLIVLLIILFLFGKYRKREIEDIKRYEDTLKELDEYIIEGRRYLSNNKSEVVN